MSKRLRVIVMPTTRGQCADIPRPCPFKRCRYNLVAERERPKNSGGRGQSRTFTDDEVELIMKWHSEGVSFKEMSRRLPHNDETIRLKLIGLGVYTPYESKFSCALDAAEEGEMSIGDVAVELGVSPGMVRFETRAALKKLRPLFGGHLVDYLPDGPEGFTEPNWEDD